MQKGICRYNPDIEQNYLFKLQIIEMVFKENHNLGTFASMRLIIVGLFLFSFLLTIPGFCQDQDSSRILEASDTIVPSFQDTAIILRDSSRIDSSLLPKQDTTTYAVASFHPQLPLNSEPVFLIQNPVSTKNQDILFYSLLGLVLYLGIIKLAFPRYLKDLFLVIFQPKFKQSQTSDILQQSAVPAFFMNVFFVITAGFFVSSVLTIKSEVSYDFWSLTLVSSMFIGGTYLTKYLFLNLSSWVLQVQNSVKKYLFIVMQLNKLFAIMILPLIWLISFGQESHQLLAVEIALVILVLTLLIRYLLSFVVLKKDLSFQVLHILIYVLAIEIIPLLIIYKLGVQFLSRTL